jgi:hypothetical protein
MEKPKAILCQQCHHYYVTWDPKAPHGCRKLGFKSAALPSAVVFTSSGMRCLHHTPRLITKNASKDKQG